MELFLNKLKDDAFQCFSDDKDFLQCPFLRNINKSTNLSFSPANFPVPTTTDIGSKGPIFEDGPNFDLAFRLFHGKDGVVPLSERSGRHSDDNLKPHSAPKFDPLAGKTATISLSAFGLGGPFGFNFFNDKLKKQKQKSDSSGKHNSQGGTSGHEAYGSEWLHTGNCPIAKSYRAVSKVLPLVAKAIQPPAGMKFRCPPAVVAARAALAQTAMVKNLRPQPLPAKMLTIAAMGMAANIPLGVWREHTQKFSVSWFIAVHAAVPFIAMLRKAVLMPKTAMALTIGASILGQVIGSRAERIRIQASNVKPVTVLEEVIDDDLGRRDSSRVEGISTNNTCGSQQMMLETFPSKGNKADASATNICF